MLIQNASTIKEIRKVAGLSISEGFPQQLNNSVQAVVDVNPANLRRGDYIKVSARTSTGDLVLATTSTARDTFISGAQLGIIKDATNDGASNYVRITVVIDGITTDIIALPTLTLTAQNSFLSVNFREPIKIDRGSAITCTWVSYAAGLCVRTAGVTGFTVELFENL